MMPVSAMTPGCNTICSNANRDFFFPLLQMLACKQAKPSEHIQTVLHYTRPCVNTCARALYKATSEANIYSVSQICVYMDIVGVPAICRGHQHTVAVRVESNFTKDSLFIEKWLDFFFSVFFLKGNSKGINVH